MPEETNANVARQNRQHTQLLDTPEAIRPNRRDLLSYAGLAAASVIPLAACSAPTTAQAPAEETPPMWTQEYWAQKGDVQLYMYRKRLGAPVEGEAPRPVLFFVHGSSTSGRSNFDLEVPEAGEYSLMNVFARLGYDTWTMDFEGYGRSTITDTTANVQHGVEDLIVATELLERETGLTRFHFSGQSSGALRAGAFAMARPDRVDRLVLAAFTYTGEGSPTLIERARNVEFYRNNIRRPRNRAMMASIFTRDRPGTGDSRVAEALADAELALSDSAPTGTYLDMTANLPVVDPTRVLAPVLLIRGVYDGIATEEDLTNFFVQLPNHDRQYVILPGLSHSVHLGYNRAGFWHAVQSFLTMPPLAAEV